MGRKRAALWLGVAVAASCWSVCAVAAAQEAPKPAEEKTMIAPPAEDDVAARQSVDAFSSLEDAQPGEPGRVELELNLGWERYTHDYSPFIVEPEIEYTGKGNPFLENLQLILNVPLEVGEGEVDGNGDVGLGWQQRWVAEHDKWPTLGTLLELRLPTGVDSSGVDVTLTGIVAKDAGPGTIYANLSGTFVGDDDEDYDSDAFFWRALRDDDDEAEDFVWAFRTGYKWRANERCALIVDYVHESKEADDGDDGNFLEIAGEYHATENLTIGPGVSIGLGNDDDQPDFGAGIRFTYAF